MVNENKKIIVSNFRSMYFYIMLWSVPIILFWLFLKNLANPLLFYLLFHFCYYPILGIIFSYKLGMKTCWRILKLFSPILFGILNASVWYITYGVTNILGESNIASPGVEYIITNSIASAIGLFVGIINRKLNNN